MCGAVLFFFFFFREKDLSSFPDPDESPEPLPSIHNPLPQRGGTPLGTSPVSFRFTSRAVLVKKKSRAECDREKRDVYEVYGLEGLRAGLEVGHPLHRAEDNQA